MKGDVEKRKRSTNKLKLVKFLGNVNVLHEIVTDTRVIATTVVGPDEHKSYLDLPKDIDLQVRASNQYLLGEDCYMELVKKLHSEYNPAKVIEDNLDKFEYLDGNKDNLKSAKLPRVVQQGPAAGQSSTSSAPELPKRNQTVVLKPPSRPPKKSQPCSSTKTSWTSGVARKAMEGIQNIKVKVAAPSSRPGKP